jgi:diacylglycerol kinase (ATP)
MVKQRPGVSVVLVSGAAGSVTEDIQERLRKVFADDLILDFDPDQDFLSWLEPGAKVVVAGGDGTVGFVARRLAGSDHALGILPLGTFNNFARSLGIPTELDAAIEVVRSGHPTPITVGRVNGRYFMEAAALGLFGAAIALGEAAKDFTFGELGRRLGEVAGAEPFDYRLTGDLQRSGRARSLVFANTPRSGAALPVASTSPVEPSLVLSLNAGASRFDLVRRAAAAVLRRRGGEPGAAMSFRRLRVETSPRVGIYADAEQAGETPADVEADVGALNVLLPARER